MARVALAATVVAASALALLLAAQSAHAEWLALPDTVESLEAAYRVDPANAEYPARLATLDASRREDLKAALRSNPWRASWWILESVQLEQDADLGAAERSLLRANAVCQYYTPRWSLASFYYRQRNRDAFLKWARLALAAGSGAPEPLFQMAARFDIAPDDAPRLLLPPMAAKVEAFRRFLVGRGEGSRTYSIASELLSLGSRENLAGVLESSEALFVAGQTDQSVALWNQAVRSGWLKAGELDPASGRSLASPVFTGGFGSAFLWRYWSPSEVVASAEADGSLRLTFSGRQPERCPILSQNLPLLAGRRYELAIESASPGGADGAGIEWAIQTVPAGGKIAGGNVAGSGLQRLSFETPPKPGPVYLGISYQRPSGHVRYEGSFSLKSVALSLLR
jgi:hypothetical protein